jgi:haloalkane dehalogenase
VIKNVGRRDGQRRGSASLAFAIHALNPDGLAIRSILPQCFGDTNQPDALVGIRAWTAELFDALDTQRPHRKWSIRTSRSPSLDNFGNSDRYPNPSHAAEIAGLFKDPAFHLVRGVSHWPEYDQTEVVAQLLKDAKKSR